MSHMIAIYLAARPVDDVLIFEVGCQVIVQRGEGPGTAHYRKREHMAIV